MRRSQTAGVGREAAAPGACVLREPGRRTVRPGPAAASLTWEARSRCLARTFQNVLSGKLSSRARHALPWGDAEAQAGLPRGLVPPGRGRDSVCIVSPMRVSAFS